MQNLLQILVKKSCQAPNPTDFDENLQASKSARGISQPLELKDLNFHAPDWFETCDHQR